MMMMETNTHNPFHGPKDQGHSSTHAHSSIQLPPELKVDSMDMSGAPGPVSSPEMESGDTMPPGEPGSALGGINGGIGMAPQPKVQTAFIHKLYNMLEDPSLQHLISWAQSNEAFVVTPTGEFSKALSSYFKHTNISSFVRQLNMYGFHKVNDVFHSTAPDSALWEFKHGNGSFKRGDLVGLREIKRRASRHTLTHKDSYSAGMRSGIPTAPGTPNELPQDSTEGRLFGMEQALWDMAQRMARVEESYSTLARRHQESIEGLTRCHQWSIDLSQYITSLVPQQDAPIHREIKSFQKEIERHTQMLEEQPQEQMRERGSFIPTLHLDNSGLSPRQRPVDDDGRRPPPALRGPPSSSGYFRAPVPSHMSVSARRFGSLSGPSPAASANSLHPSHAQSQDRPPPRALGHLQPPSSLSRRHTSADIRLTPGWNPAFANQASQGVQWGNSSSSRSRPESNLHNSFANYEIQQGPSPNSKASYASSPRRSPPFAENVGSIPETSSWSFATAKVTNNNASKLDPPPPHAGSRRSSLATNSVHALLNPSSGMNDTSSGNSNNSDRDSDCEPLNDDRKRKRVS